jgi:tetratricopeptide (TPR) repeat protein
VPSNDRLAALMTEAGYLDRKGEVGRKRFARAVTEAPSARAAGRTFSHTYVSRWLSGTVPRDADTRNAIREALESKLGRSVSPDELGFRADTIPADTGLAYPDSPGSSVEAVAQLFQADLAEVTPIVEAPANVAAWNEAAMAWLVGDRLSPTDVAGSRSIGGTDVERIRAMRHTFDRLDSTYGGAHARSALVQYLRSELPPLLRARGSAPVRQSMYSAAGELTQLAAWMAYDAGLHGLAQRYFIQALALADAATDRLLAASILDAMSHQATFLGRYREAANMARAARLGTESIGVPILSSHFHVMEARALARTGDKAACDRAMIEAVRHFELQASDDKPEWIAYFDEAELTAELGHCQRDLGRSSEAVRHATDALRSTSGDYIRSDFFVGMVLAHSLLDAGELEEGLEAATRAFIAGEGLDSERCRSYVDELKARLGRHRSSPEVKTFVSNARGHQLWRSTRA